MAFVPANQSPTPPPASPNASQGGPASPDASAVAPTTPFPPSPTPSNVVGPSAAPAPAAPTQVPPPAPPPAYPPPPVPSTAPPPTGLPAQAGGSTGVYKPRSKAKAVVVTVLGVLGIFATAYAAQYAWNLWVGAEETSAPQDVTVANYTNNSVTISWATNLETAGFVSYGETESLGETGAVEEEAQVHSVTLTGLQSGGTYYYKIGVGQEVYGQPTSAGEASEVPYSFTLPTASQEPSTVAMEGIVRDLDGQPASRVLVLARVKDYDGTGSSGYSTPISTLTTEAGAWSLAVTNVWEDNLTTPFQFSLTADHVELEFDGVEQGSAQVVLPASQIESIPEVMLSASGGLLDLTAGEDPTQPEVGAGEEAGAEEGAPGEGSTVQPTVESPQEGYSSEETPIFSGSGEPGDSLTITIESPDPVTDIVYVDEGGTWTYTLPSQLEPGSHTVTISGNQGYDIRAFTIGGPSSPEVPEGAGFGGLGGEEGGVGAEPQQPESSPASPSAIPQVGTAWPTVLVVMVAGAMMLAGIALELKRW